MHGMFPGREFIQDSDDCNTSLTSLRYGACHMNGEGAMFLKKFDLRGIIDKAFEELIDKAFGKGVIKLWMLDGL